MGIIENASLVKKAFDVYQAIQEELLKAKLDPGFSWKVAVWKGAKSFLSTAFWVATAALLLWASDPANLGAAFQRAGSSEQLMVALVPLLAALGKMALNWLGNRNDPGMIAGRDLALTKQTTMGSD